MTNTSDCEQTTNLLIGSQSNSEPSNKMIQIQVDRPALTLDLRNKHYSPQAVVPLSTTDKFALKIRKSCTCTRQKVWSVLVNKLPILGWLIGYDFKNWFLGDFIAGMTIAVFHIPQGMGYALLANIPAICGIYMAFYPVMIYAILSTSRHNSMGSFAVVTLMTGKIVSELATFPDPGEGGSFSNRTDGVTIRAIEDPEEAITYTPIEVATIVCFMVGLWQALFGFLRLGALSVFLSDMLVSGFTTACAFHVLTSQMKDLLGIQIPRFSGPLKLIYTYIEIVNSISTINLAALIITALTTAVLIINNEILKPILAKRTKIPIPIELFVVIIGTSASYFADFNENFGIEIVGDIPTGMPPAKLPPLDLITRVAMDSLVIAIVAYTVSFSVAKIISLKEGYKVDATQELYAQGFGNLFGSFFSCPPMSSALGRTLLQVSVGGKTQMSSLINCFFLIFVLLFIGPLFETLPKSCLASIICVVMKGMFLQVRDVIAMWGISRIEAMTWLVTFFSVVIIDIDFGLFIGIIFSLVVLINKNQSVPALRLGRVPNTDVYLNLETYPQAEEIRGLSIFKIVGCIDYANQENLRTNIVKGTLLDVKGKTSNRVSDDQNIRMEAMDSKMIPPKVKFIILDMSGVSYLDSSGAKFLATLRIDYENVDVILCIAGLSDGAYKLLQRSDYLKEFSPLHLFHSLHDAVIILSS